MTTDANAPWLIVGLGNPGPEYANNRHNVGFMVADLLAERVGGRFKRAGKAQAQVLEGRIGAPGPASRRVVLVKPTSFMNLSGGPVNALRDFYKVPLANVVAVHDELDIDYGTLRLKLGGGDNGHNGLKSMTKAMGPDYPPGAVRHRTSAGPDAGRRLRVEGLLLHGAQGTGLPGGPGDGLRGVPGERGPGAGAERVQLLSRPTYESCPTYPSCAD